MIFRRLKHIWQNREGSKYTMDKKEAISLINSLKNFVVLNNKNTHFASKGNYHGRYGWWINIPFLKFEKNLYLILYDKDRLIFIEILANSITNPKLVFRKWDETKSDIFIAKTDNHIYMDEQSGGANYIFNDHHKVLVDNEIQEKMALDISEYNEYIESAIEKSTNDSKKKRLQRLNASSKYPDKIETIVTQFKRNPDVIVEVLKRANGVCEKCQQDAPFVRKKDNTPYLEVHHIVRLASGGEDTVANAIAVCPNCHRELHYG